MDAASQSALVTAAAGIVGSIVGGLASFATTYFTQRNQIHRELVSREAAHREELYSQFVHEATNLYIDSLSKTLENPVALIGLYSLIGRIRLIAGDRVLSAAERNAEAIVDSYRRPPRTFEAEYKFLREHQIDPLNEFTQACREERRSLLTSL